MFARPLANLLGRSIGVAVVVVTVPITFVEPLLVLMLELVVEEDAIDARAALRQTLGMAFIGAIDLDIVFQLPLAFHAVVGSKSMESSE